MKSTELDLARQLIAGLAGEFEPAESLQSDYRRDLRAMLEAKLEGREIAVPEPAEEAPTVDLMAALKASVAAASRKKPAADEKPKTQAKPGGRSKSKSG